MRLNWFLASNLGVLVLGMGCSLLRPRSGLSVERIIEHHPVSLTTELRATESDSTTSNPLRQPSSLSSAKLQWPLKNMHLSSKFGRRYGAKHQGVDLRSPIGTPIYAAASGVVIYAGDEINGYGQTLILRHEGGISTLYAHASALIVEEGQTIKRGQAIAYVGDTGNATGPHLHFEVRKGTKPVDPWPYVYVSRRLASTKAKGSKGAPNSQPLLQK